MAKAAKKQAFVPGPSCGQFGPAVIGEEQFEKEQAAVKEGTQVFGPAVLDATGKPPTRPVPKGANIAGPLVGAEGAPPEKPPAAPEKVADDAPAGLSVEGVIEYLEDNPKFAAVLLDQEIARPDPRKGALEAIKRTAEKTGDAATVINAGKMLERLEGKGE